MIKYKDGAYYEGGKKYVIASEAHPKYANSEDYFYDDDDKYVCVDETDKTISVFVVMYKNGVVYSVAETMESAQKDVRESLRDAKAKEEPLI